MKTYAIGDLQGCAHEAAVLLKRIADDAPGGARIIYVGDLINRGPESLTALRQVAAMSRAPGGQVDAVLGNHDLHLLAVACGAQSVSPSDTLNDILAAPDRAELLDWLRHRPLALMAKGHLLVHAGVLPQWSAERTLELAGEVEAVLRGPGWMDFLGQMYGNEPDRWDDSLTGIARLRCIVNALTRMRLCTPDGVMDFKQKESAGAPPGSGLLPWFDLPNRQSAGTPIVFGHWSALGVLHRSDVVGLDSGCVWGGRLTAVCLDTRVLIDVDCPQYKRHGGPRA
ncbi:symmetrical bis(5'-nucleosyl)-tetraphosphatase [Massilia sp. PAMC28688]|uniref:symmetrical bis(5'-nucleosyl)-tetraphosphatase n=1 Tax=Massilia sp. PAMC28688 TaxID=2861283 RepID=UPI001C638822|nr:symmetrical bis(5'-nucleosyl)-tetraphosphatase [Massilia sp. PAMC28688]QYF91632.1 symmetrical bis(5'-nucleosyl)-tetraphosphatase [Massilia sp. PAMC28688]